MNYFKFMITCKWAIPEKIPTEQGGGGWLRIFRFVTLVCLCHWSFIYFWKFHKIVILIEISKAKRPRPMPWKFHIIFSWSVLTWKFHFFFIEPSEIWNVQILFIYSILLEFPGPQPPSLPPSTPLCRFLWNGIAKLIKTDVTGLQHHE